MDNKKKNRKRMFLVISFALAISCLLIVVEVRRNNFV